MEGGFRVKADQLAMAAEQAAGAMRALSNPSRLLILGQLAAGEKTVGELEDALDLGQAYVSQQLARLRDDGIVAATRDGRQMRYRLTDQRIAPLIEVIYKEYCAYPI
ncbi:MAG: metalloregulator ArsR/SmtB family transcription factor [Pseudomonadota bacterium]